MKVIFGTTSKRKVEDLEKICKRLNLDMEILCLKDIGWDLGDIEENGSTIEENSLIKAQAIHEFCVSKGISYPIITDDSGLFCEGLNGEPGVYTARYGDDEIMENHDLPDYQCVIKLLRKLNGNSNRQAAYRSCVTCMMPDGSYFQEEGKSNGTIAEEIASELTKPYFYAVFVLEDTNCAFSELDDEKLLGTYRYHALGKTLKKIKED